MTLLRGDGAAAVVTACVRKGECGGVSDQLRDRGHAECV